MGGHAGLGPPEGNDRLMPTSRELEYGECGRVCNPVDGHGWTGACRIYKSWVGEGGRTRGLPAGTARDSYEASLAKRPDKRKAAEFERETDDDGPLRVEHHDAPTLADAITEPPALTAAVKRLNAIPGRLGYGSRIKSVPYTPPVEEDHTDGPLTAKPDMIIKADRELTDGEYRAMDRQIAGSHYMNASGIQPWHVIDAYGLDFYRGNALKYLLRAGKKGPALEDLRKARHYLDRIIEMEQEKTDG